MSALEHAAWWAFIGLLVVVAISLNSCGSDYNHCCGKNHLWREQAIQIMGHRCAEHRRVWGWRDKDIDDYRGIIEWTCGDGTAGSQEYDS